MPTQQTKSFKKEPPERTTKTKSANPRGSNKFGITHDGKTHYIVDPDKPLEHRCQVAVRWKDGTFAFPLICHAKRPERVKAIAIMGGPFGDVARGFKRENVFRIVGYYTSI